jgi:hypothetical protein
MGTTWASMMPGRTLEEWREINFRWATTTRAINAKRRAAVVTELLGDAPEVSKFRFIKIGFPKGSDAKIIYTKLTKLMDSNLYKCGNSIAVIEYFSASHPKGGNLHIHLLTAATYTARVGITAKQLGQYFGIAPNFVEVDQGRGATAFEQKLKYVCGDKAAVKMPFVQLDAIWREKMGFPPFSNFFDEQLRLKFVKYLGDSQTEKL